MLPLFCKSSRYFRDDLWVYGAPHVSFKARRSSTFTRLSLPPNCGGSCDVIDDNIASRRGAGITLIPAFASGSMLPRTLTLAPPILYMYVHHSVN